MSGDVLIISTMEGAVECARAIGEQVGTKVEVALSRRAGLAALRGAEFGVVVVEESLTEGDPEWADQVWEGAGLAVALQINFAISGHKRLGREVKAALQRRKGEQRSARRVAMQELEDELKTSVTGLLLESELALEEPALSPRLEGKLKHLVELAVALRERLRERADGPT